MGGNLPLGYDVQDRKLVINEAEAATVTQIFQLYLALGSVRLLQAQLAAAGVRSKSRPLAESPKMRGGQVLARGAVHLILQNRLYRGEVVHQGNVYHGEHAAIIGPEQWDAVQARLTDNRVEQQSGARAANPSLLTGLIYDGAGERLLPTHTAKGERRDRYYGSKALQTGGAPSSAAGMRIPAGDIERAVTDRLTQFLGDRSVIYTMVSAAVGDGAEQATLIDRAATLAADWSNQPLIERRALLRRLVSSITVHPKRIDILLDSQALIAILAAAQPSQATADHQETEIETIAQPVAEPVLLTIQVHLKRAGLEMRMLVDGVAGTAEPDPTVIMLILSARQLRDRMMAERLGVGELAASEGVTASYITRIIRLGFLAPDIVTAILNGGQPVGLTANKLANDSRLPIGWTEQRRVLGFG